jgi:hypothetical protein
VSWLQFSFVGIIWQKLLKLHASRGTRVSQCNYWSRPNLPGQ